ncbi:MAG: hypothetical protein RI580_06215 [Halothece sp. Uz-M2-17]|nr:hypothetical protein [Halothece sp. Uz-M2-17]
MKHLILGIAASLLVTPSAIAQPLEKVQRKRAGRRGNQFGQSPS